MLHRVIVLIFTVLCAAAGSAQNLLNNPSFEAPSAPGCSFGTSCIIPDWTVTGCGGTPNIIIPACGSGSPNPTDGSQAIQIYSETGSGITTLSQTVAVTPGCDYLLTFDYSSVYSTVECFDWGLSTGQSGQAVGTSSWQSESVNFTATGPSVTLTISNSPTALCPGSTNGFSYTSPQADNFSIVLTGCPTSADTTRATVSGCDSVVFDGTTYFASTTDTFTGTNVAGDDSLHITTIVVAPSYDIVLPTITGCDSAFADGVWFFADTVVRETFLTAAGCDSIRTRTIDVSESDHVLINDTTCDPASGGTTVDSFTNVAGCDSIITTITTVLPTVDSLIALTSCNPADTGTVVDTLVSTSSCDTIIRTVTSLLRSEDTTLFASSCNPADTGTVVDSLVNAVGCDSVVTTITGLLRSEDTTLFASSCNPADTGTVVDSLVNAVGCDSVVTTITGLLRSEDTTLFASSCNPADTGTVVDSLVNAVGCDSVVTTITGLLRSEDTTLFASSCNPADTGTVVDSLVNAVGCDSVVTTVTALLRSEDTTLLAASCNPADTGTVVDSFVNAVGCDSVVTTITAFDPIDTVRTAVFICSGASHSVGTSTYTSSGVYIDDLISIDGCDSIVETTLTVGPTYAITRTDTFCSNTTYTLPDGSFTDVPLTVVDTLPSIDGCDSIVTLDLATVDPTPIAPRYPDTTFCLSDGLLIDLRSTNDVVSVRWPDGTSSPFYALTGPDTLVVDLTQRNGCVVSDTLRIGAEDCVADCRVTAPTGFTPNGDGANDVFRVLETCADGFAFFEFQVFSRWGDLIFSTTDPGEGWDGTMNGRPAPIGTYVYSVAFTKTGSDRSERRDGTVTLLR